MARNYKDEDERDRSPFRNLARSTRQALTATISPFAALQAARQAQSVAQTQLTPEQRVAEMRRGVGGSSLYSFGAGSRMQGRPGSGGDVIGAYGDIAGSVARQVLGGGVSPPSLSVPSFVSPQQVMEDSQAAGQFGPFEAELSEHGRIFDAMGYQIERMQQQMEAAIAAGEAEVAQQYDEEINRLKGAQAKLVAGRAAVNEQYAGLQAGLEADRDQIAAQQIVDSGTDVAAEVDRIASLYDQGSESLNGMLRKIGADSPQLAAEVGNDLARFSELAEVRLRSDLEGIEAVSRAGQIFAQKAADAVTANTAVDAEEARTGIEWQIQQQIDKIVGQVEQLQADKLDAMQKVRDTVGDYDIAWLDDYDAVRDVFIDKWFDGQDLTIEERAEFRSMFESVWSGLSTEQRNRQGLTAWARDNMVDVNMAKIMEALGATNQSELEDAIAGWQAGLGNELALIDEFDATPYIQGLLAFAETGGQINDPLLNFITDSIGSSLDFVTMDDYADLLDLGEIMEEFANGGYQSFVDEQKAIYAGAGVSPNAINGANLTRSDMVQVRGPSGSVGYLHPGAADAFNRMVQAAAADGINLSWSDTYRSWETQNKAYQNFIATGTNLNGVKVPNIAHPDKSNHPRGLAVDFNTGGGALEWLRANASRFGWGPISNEDWHWEYRGSLGQYSTVGGTIGGGATATTTVTTEPGTSPSGATGGGGGRTRVT